jgi:hypothetical protein
MQAQNRNELMNTDTMAATMYWKRACTAVVKKSGRHSSSTQQQCGTE